MLHPAQYLPTTRFYAPPRPISAATRQVMHILRQQAYPNRAVGQTSMNEQSSRSHCLLFVNVAGRNRLNDEVTHSKLVLVDLAGMCARPANIL